MVQTFPTQAINPIERNHYMYGAVSRGGPVTVGTYYGETAYAIRASVAGLVVVEGVDGNPIVIPALQVGETFLVKHTRVLTSALIDGNTYTTAATGLFWYGGAS
jgi:hypothetical protein